ISAVRVLELLLSDSIGRLRIRVGAERQFATPDRFKRTSDSNVSRLTRPLRVLSKKIKGPAQWPVPPTRSSLSLAFRRNWGRRRGFALAERPSVLRIARSDAKESKRRCSQ